MSGRVTGTYCLGFFAAAITFIHSVHKTARTMPLLTQAFATTIRNYMNIYVIDNSSANRYNLDRLDRL
jgi:hypothetical protein